MEKQNTYKHLKGRTNAEKLVCIDVERQNITERDKKITPAQYATIIYHWLMKNKNVYSIMDFFNDATNEPFLYSIDEIQEVKSKKIEKLLEQRLINAALKKEINGSFAQLVLQNHYGWTKGEKTTEVEISGPIKFDFA